MNDFYVQLSVSEAARMLETETTYVYKLIREGQIIPARTAPIKLTLSSVVSYLKKRLPSGFDLVQIA